MARSWGCKLEAMARQAIGIEIGGTKLQVGVGEPAHPLAALVRHRVDSVAGAAGIRAALPALVADALTQAGVTLADISRIGIGFGGPLDTVRGVTLQSFQISGWDNFPLRAWAESQWRKPVTIQNDASTAGLAEALFGAGRGASRVFYMTIGSGIGGGWVVDGQVDEGQGLGAAEIGHMWVPAPDDRAGAEAAELELVCSGWSIARRAQRAATQEPSLLVSMAGTLEQIDARIVYAAAERGDAVAQRILRETCQTLGLALANIVALLHPERIVIGGGVSLMGPLFWDPLRAAVQERSMAAYAPRVEVVPAAFGEEVVVVGATLLGSQGARS